MFLLIMCSLANIYLFLQFRRTLWRNFIIIQAVQTSNNVSHSNNVRMAFDHISDFKCVNKSIDINENVDFMYDYSVIEMNNLLENFNDVQIHSPKASVLAS